MEQEVWTVGRILSWIEGFLSERGDENPRLSAQWLVSEAMNTSRIQLYADLERPLTDAERAVLRGYTKRRAMGKPLQYITGTTDFRFVTVKVRPGVLIPRPETEVLVSEALAELKPLLDYQKAVHTVPQVQLRVIDACTGSGCIACALASEIPWAQVVATDISDEAIALSRENVASLGLDAQVQVEACDLLLGVREDWINMVDLIISNPPYIPTSVLGNMEAQVTDFEPLLALDGGADGLALFRALLPQAQEFLKPDGVFAVELHEDCLEEAADAARSVGFTKVRIAQDLTQRPRVLIAHMPSDLT